jgi:hypothetical protein
MEKGHAKRNSALFFQWLEHFTVPSLAQQTIFEILALVFLAT